MEDIYVETASGLKRRVSLADFAEIQASKPGRVLMVPRDGTPFEVVETDDLKHVLKSLDIQVKDAPKAEPAKRDMAKADEKPAKRAKKAKAG